MLSSGILGVVSGMVVVIQGWLNLILFKILPVFAGIGAIIFCLLYMNLI